MSIEKEMEGVNFNDARLSRRYVKIVRRVKMNPGISFPKMIENWSELKGLYRFFTNKKVTHKNILLPHKAKTVERCMEEDTVLFVQDTTYLNYAHHPGTMGLGLIGKEKSLIGMIVHNGYAVSGRDKKPLGLLHQKVIIRKGKVKKDREKKESKKWEEGLKESVRLLKRHKKVIQVCDREADIYFFIRKIIEVGQSFVIRCAWNRKTEDGYIFDEIKNMEIRGNTKINIGRNGKRKRRIANISIRSGRLRILPPKSIDRRGPVLETNVVVAEEQGPPSKESKIYWVLLTGESVESNQECLRIIEYYQSRWLIEEFHKGLKSGCKIEERQLQTCQQLKKLLGMFSILCYNILLIRYEARKETTGCVVLNSIQVEYLRNKFRKEIHGRLTAKKVLYLVGRIGGFIGRKSDGEPGWLVLMRGISSLIGIEEAYRQGYMRAMKDVGKG